MDLNQNPTGALSAGTFAQGRRLATGLGLVIGTPRTGRDRDQSVAYIC